MSALRPYLAGLVVVVLWASAFPAIRVASPELGVIGLSLLRLAVAAVALLAIAPITGVRRPARSDLPLVVACAFFGMTAYQLLLNWGELGVPAGPASMIVAAAPLVSIGVATVSLGERLTFLRALGSLVAIGGVALVCIAHSGASMTSAIWLVVGASVVQGIYHPLTKSLLRKHSGLEVATYCMVAGTIMTLPLVPWGLGSIAAVSGSAWWSAIYLGVFPSALGFVLWGYAVARLPVASSTSLLYLVPAVAVGIAYVWLGETPYASELFGGLVVIVGVLLVSQGDRLVARLGGLRRTSRSHNSDPQPERPGPTADRRPTARASR